MRPPKNHDQSKKIASSLGRSTPICRDRDALGQWSARADRGAFG